MIWQWVTHKNLNRKFFFFSACSKVFSLSLSPSSSSSFSSHPFHSPTQKVSFPFLSPSPSPFLDESKKNLISHLPAVYSSSSLLNSPAIPQHPPCVFLRLIAAGSSPFFPLFLIINFPPSRRPLTRSRRQRQKQQQQHREKKKKPLDKNSRGQFHRF